MYTILWGRKPQLLVLSTCQNRAIVSRTGTILGANLLHDTWDNHISIRETALASFNKLFHKVIQLLHSHTGHDHCMCNFALYTNKEFFN